MKNLLKLVVITFILDKSFSQVTLAPAGEIRVCKGTNQQFKCLAPPLSLWTVFGFGSGIVDIAAATGARSYTELPNNERVESNDSSFLTFKNLGYADDNAVVGCENELGMRAMSTIRIAPTNCTRDFMELNTTSSTITVKLAVSNCNGSYQVTARLSPGASASGNVMVLDMNITSTVFLVSSLEANTMYEVELVDIECPNVILQSLRAMTQIDPNPTSSTVSSTSSTTVPPTPPGTLEGTAENVPAIVGGTVGGLIVVVLIVIIVVVAVVIIKQKNVKKAGGERLTAQHGEEMVDVHGDTTYAAPGKDKAAVEGGDGVYSYAATTTVVGAQHNKPGGETKVSVQPEKPKRGSKKQPPPADVPHKQGPVGDLYAMPDKKAPEVGHKAGPQGDMYAMAAKPSKGGYGAEGP